MLPLIDRYILSKFLYNFFSSFVILMVIFIFQTVWLFIDDLAGKDLDIWIIGKFLFYLMPNLTEKVMPLTVLLSSILTFGSFAENYEFAAMKASGISLQKAMRSLIVFTVLLGIFTFFFANTVIPASEQKIFNMRRNIAKLKPAAVIIEGAFCDIEGTDMNIKVGRKYGDNDQFLEDIIIHQKSKKTNVNTTVIKAKTGELISSEESDIIQLVLNDGQYYEESLKKSKEKKKHPFNRSNFEVYTKNIDISSLSNKDLEKESDITTDKMKNIFRLSADIDSLKINNLKRVKAFSKSIYSRMGAFPIDKADSLKEEKNIKKAFKNLKKIERPDTTKSEGKTKDTVIKIKSLDSTKIEEKIKDTVKTIEGIMAAVQKRKRKQLLINSKNALTNVLGTINAKKSEINKRYEFRNKHILSFHKKFALALSCIILFFVAAPLGAIIRKGGLGLPMVIAIILFLIYYFIGVFAENYAKKGEIHPIFGAWLSAIIMLPLSIFLTKKATADRGLTGFGTILNSIKSTFKKKEKLT